MKKTLLCLAVLSSILTSPSFAALENAKPTRLYGKITAVDPGQKKVTVFNKKRQTESVITWNDFTAVTNNKKAIRPQDLNVGQYLMVDVRGEGDQQVASKIAVRAFPGKKKATQ